MKNNNINKSIIHSAFGVVCIIQCLYFLIAAIVSTPFFYIIAALDLFCGVFHFKYIRTQKKLNAESERALDDIKEDENIADGSFKEEYFGIDSNTGMASKNNLDSTNNELDNTKNGVYINDKGDVLFTEPFIKQDIKAENEQYNNSQADNESQGNIHIKKKTFTKTVSKKQN